MLADVRRSAWPTDPFFGDTTVNIGVIAGGSRPNVVAGEARADLQIRLVTDAEPVKRLLGQIVGGRARIEYLTAVNPLHLTTVPGFETCVVRFTTDIPHLTNWGTPLLIGPGSILDAHTAHERIALAELTAGTDAYVRLVRALLQGRVAALSSRCSDSVRWLAWSRRMPAGRAIRSGPSSPHGTRATPHDCSRVMMRPSISRCRPPCSLTWTRVWGPGCRSSRAPPGGSARRPRCVDWSKRGAARSSTRRTSPSGSTSSIASWRGPPSCSGASMPTRRSSRKRITPASAKIGRAHV